MGALYIALAPVALYIFFIVAPSVVAYFTIFTRMSGSPIDSFPAKGTQYEPFMDELKRCRDHISSLGGKNVSIKSHDGLTLRGEYYDLGYPRTAIFCHGYRSNRMMNFAMQGEFFANEGYNLLIICERAHDDSEGKRSTLGVLEGEDILRWDRFAKEQDGVKSTVIYGMSMGATATCLVSDRLDGSVRALIIDCGFRSAYEQLKWDCVKRRLPWRLLMPHIRLMAKIFSGIDICDSASSHLSKTTVPAFFFHGTEDTTVPYSEGKSNFDSCASVKEMFTSDGAAHTVAFAVGGERAKLALRSFLDRVSN